MKLVFEPFPERPLVNCIVVDPDGAVAVVTPILESESRFPLIPIVLLLLTNTLKSFPLLVLPVIVVHGILLCM